MVLISKAIVNGWFDPTNSIFTGDPLYLAVPNDFPSGATGTLTAEPNNAQNGATAFATPIGFAADYLSGLGHCFGFNQNILVPAVAGTYAIFIVRNNTIDNVSSTNVVSKAQISISKSGTNILMTGLSNDVVTLTLVEPDSVTPNYTYRFGSISTSGRSSFIQINFTSKGLALYTQFANAISIPDQNAIYGIMKRK